MSESDDLYGDTVYENGDDDAEFMDPAENLTGEALEEPQDEGYSPPDHRPSNTRYGTTAFEQEQGESLDQRLAEEEPDVDADSLAGDGADPRAGRLVAPDEGAHADEESDEIAFDVGIAGSAASAEEAAVHVVDEDDVDPDFVEEETLTEDR